jgi:hypothetical protein
MWALSLPPHERAKNQFHPIPNQLKNIL